MYRSYSSIFVIAILTVISFSPFRIAVAEEPGINEQEFVVHDYLTDCGVLFSAPASCVVIEIDLKTGWHCAFEVLPFDLYEQTQELDLKGPKRPFKIVIFHALEPDPRKCGFHYFEGCWGIPGQPGPGCATDITNGSWSGLRGTQTFSTYDESGSYAGYGERAVAGVWSESGWTACLSAGVSYGCEFGQVLDSIVFID